MTSHSTIEVEAIDHIVLRTDSPARLIDFYRDVLGCSIERETPTELGLTQLRAGNALIDIISVQGELGRPGGAAPGIEGKNLDHFCLRLKPIDETQLLDHLKHHDIACEDFKERYGAEGFGRSVYVRDPDGNTVELRSGIDP